MGSKRNKIKLKITTIGRGIVAASSFRECTSLKAVWISVNTTRIFAGSTGGTRKPFTGCTNLTDIYTDAISKKLNWGSYFNYTDTSTQATVHYGYSEADFDALVVE